MYVRGVLYGETGRIERMVFRAAFVFMAMISSLTSVSASQYTATVEVGKITAGGPDGGAVRWFMKKDGSAFPHCTTQPTHMWVDPDFAVVNPASTPDAVRAAAAKQTAASLLITARLTSTPVTVAYDVDANGVCLYQFITLE